MVQNKFKKKCPICGAKINWEGNKWRPFCTERCKLIDLGDWAQGKYSIEGEEKGSEEEDKDQKKREEE
ncbi:MAG: hypothetical protein A3F16_05320 [Deltaproteobacteria bacterium RIFCSPHIGHO2_12_FULL_43_9]|nr:MAG: hypothetical protein A3F16_05320 [Deltaproteobacteria bacterium RIFCSPHIGHO2_12_FULL_43_9]